MQLCLILSTANTLYGNYYIKKSIFLDVLNNACVEFNRPHTSYSINSKNGFLLIIVTKVYLYSLKKKCVYIYIYI